MANFSPGWNFVSNTWRSSAWSEILASAPNMKFRVRVSGESKWHREHESWKYIGALLLSQFSLLAALNFQLFGMVTAYKMMKLKQNLSLAAYLSARKTYLQKKRRYLQARRGHGFPNSLVLLIALSALKSMFSQSIWALKLERQWIRFSILLP